MKNHIETLLLKIAYLELGEAENPVVLLLHGWPDDATTWHEVMPELAKSGYRVIAPWLRGFGETTFQNKDIPRTGNFGILALDAIALMDNLGIEKFSVVGHDWGTNIADSLAVGWPDRVKKIVMISSGAKIGGIQTSAFRQAQREWYQWFMCTGRGAETVRLDPIGFAHLMWENWGPKNWFTEEIFNEVSQSWLNPDFAEVTIHSYRSRWGEAELDDLSVTLEEKIKATKTLSLPALFLQGEEDGVLRPEVTEDMYKKFTGPFKRVLIPGVGHFPSREQPAELSRLLIDFVNS